MVLARVLPITASDKSTKNASVFRPRILDDFEDENSTSQNLADVWFRR